MVQSLDDARRRRGAAGRIPPHDLVAEESLLGAMLLSRDAVATAGATCAAEDFYKPAHGHIFDAIQALYARGEPADPVTVADELRRSGLLDATGGQPALQALQANTPAIGNAARYARIVEEHALLRRLIGVAGEIAELGYELPDDVAAALDRAESLVFDVGRRRIDDKVRPLRDLLEQTLDHLERLYEGGDAVTGVPTGFIDLDQALSGLQPANLVIVGARPSMGKCVAWDTPVIDPVSGALRTAAEVHRLGTAGEDIVVASLDTGHRLRHSTPSAFVDDGIKPVYRVRTRLGRELRTTMSHPFLTPTGWRPLHEITVGTRVAVPRRLPYFGTDALPPAEVVLLAYLLGDGALTGDAPRFVTPSQRVLDDLVEHATAFGVDVLPERAVDGSQTRTYRLVSWRHGVVAPDRQGEPASLVDVLQRHGLWGRRAAEKRVPDAVYRLPRQQMALFLNRLFATHGSASWSGAGHGRISYCSVSRRLIQGMQHLLLRFGIMARTRERSVVHRGHPRHAYELELAGTDDIARFASEIGMLGHEDAIAGLTALARPHRGGQHRKTVPAAVWSLVAQARDAESRVVSPGAAVSNISTAVRCEADLGDWAASDVYWDEVVAIAHDGDEQVYDLTVPGDHNFVAADVFVHNTSFALNIAAHAALEASQPVLVFSLEMSHEELTKRLLSSEAKVDARKLQNGRLSDEEWRSISRAIGRLAEAPLFIDDTPNVTVMDIRAKARRMMSQSGLGLVVVDYIQLMTGRTSVENRQVEVSEISRGLKILARELNVPVLALSQLSRNLEMRADKRPMLADLRESGSLEQDADVVMFIYRDEKYHEDSDQRGMAQIIIAKHRNGPTGISDLIFREHFTRFDNASRAGL